MRAGLSNAKVRPRTSHWPMDYRIAHILVDEFQDTSLGQYRLLQTLMESWHEGDGNSFFAVGDPMQSVYRFRDADVRLFPGNVLREESGRYLSGGCT